MTELNSLYDNLRGEVIIAEIQDNFKKDYDFVIKNDSTFSRSFSRDVISIESSEDKDHHVFTLSRNGIYDSLPEGFFHGKAGKGRSFAAQRAGYKEEEKQARLFFSPLENEFFRQRLQIEKNERALLGQFYKLRDGFLIDFWKLDAEIPKKYLLKLIKLLPFASKISGDIELTRLCLEKILGTRVAFKKKLYAPEIDEVVIEDQTLGLDMVLPTQEPEIHELGIEAIIGPVQNNLIDSFLKHKGILEFVKLFFEYFIPVDVEISTRIIGKENSVFHLDDNEMPVLGVSTQI